jgi:phosphatidylserine/phosphatidylglycerophosphate/cardiolipin synthase-like enzyme
VGIVEGVVGDLVALSAEGMAPAHIGLMLSLLADERESVQGQADRVELVWTGPELGPTASRDTAVVVRELFDRAERNVLLAGFAIYNGREIFDRLAANIDRNPSLDVKMFLNISRSPGDDRTEAQIVTGFRQRFMEEHWPGQRPPELYHDPRALSPDPARRAVLHAKCVVVDDRWSFITSANFTEAAQDRNIEAGVLIEDAVLAGALRGQFLTLSRVGVLRRME